MEPLITVALPTYNRPDFLDFFLKTHLDLFVKLNVKLCISNNGNDLKSKQVIESWAKKYNNISYSSTENVVSSDENIKNAISMSNTEFTWLIGDTYEITEKVLIRVLNVIQNNKKADFFILNLVDRYHHHSKIKYTDRNDVIRELGIIIACISCNIFKTDRIDYNIMKKYWGTDFSILGYNLDFISKNDFELIYLPDASVITLKTPQRKTGWPHRFFEIMFVNWLNFVDQLPKCYLSQDKELLKVMLIEKSGICNWRNILNVRGSGWLNHFTFNAHKFEIRKYGSRFLYTYMNVLRFIPPFLCNFCLYFIEKYRRYSFLIKNKIRII